MLQVVHVHAAGLALDVAVRVRLDDVLGAAAHQDDAHVREVAQHARETEGAVPEEDQVAGIAPTHGLPILKNVTAWMVGTIVARTPVADNAMIAVQIDEGALGDPDEPLLYHERSFRALGAEL